MKISAVMAIYNEEHTIEEFSSRLLRALEALGADYEIIFVLEGRDSTLAKLAPLAAANPRVKLDYTESRMGLGRALRKGLSLIAEDASDVLTMDADLNHQPEEIGKLVEARGRADIVVGSRGAEGASADRRAPLRRLLTRLGNALLRMCFCVPSQDVTSGFRLYSAGAIRRVRGELTGKDFEITPEVLIRAARAGFTLAEVPITFHPRPRGKSKLGFARAAAGYAVLLLRLAAGSVGAGRPGATSPTGGASGGCRGGRPGRSRPPGRPGPTGGPRAGGRG